MRKKQIGAIFLIEALMAVTIMGMAFASWMYYQTEQGFADQARHSGQFIAKLSRATDDFVASNLGILTDSQPTGTVCDNVQGTASNPAAPTWKLTIPRIYSAAYPLQPGTSGISAACAAVQPPVPAALIADNITEIPFQMLLDAGFLDQGATNRDELGNSYRVFLLRRGTPGYYQIDAMIVGSGPVLRSNKGSMNQPDWSDVGAAMETGGANVGVIRVSSANDVALGFTGAAGELSAFGMATTDGTTRRLGWFYRFQDWGFPNAFVVSNFYDGTLVGRAGYASTDQSGFVRADGTVPMSGDLNLNDYSITNVKNIQITGNHLEGDACTAKEEGRLSRLQGGDVGAGIVSSYGILECHAGYWTLIDNMAKGHPYEIAGPSATDAAMASYSIVVPEGASKAMVYVQGASGGGAAGTGQGMDPFHYEKIQTGNTITVNTTCDAFGVCTTTSSQTPYLTDLLKLQTGIAKGGDGGGTGGTGLAFMRVNPGEKMVLSLGRPGIGGGPPVPGKPNLGNAAGNPDGSDAEASSVWLLNAAGTSTLSYCAATGGWGGKSYASGNGGSPLVCLNYDATGKQVETGAGLGIVYRSRVLTGQYGLFGGSGEMSSMTTDPAKPGAYISTGRGGSGWEGMPGGNPIGCAPPSFPGVGGAAYTSGCGTDIMSGSMGMPGRLKVIFY